MTKLCSFLMLILLAFTVGGCVQNASSEQLAPEPSATIRAKPLAQPPGPGATPTTPATTPTAMATATHTQTPGPTPLLPTSEAMADLIRMLGSTPLSHAVPTTTVVPPVETPLPSRPPASCPVTQPPEPAFDPPGKPVDVFPGEFWYGSDDLYLALPLDGTWPQLAKGDKVFWWSIHYPGGREENFPDMIVRGRRLDEPGQTVEQVGATNASHPSFPATAMLHGLHVPARGCWEISGEYRGNELSFVVWVP